jgi:hypothetical protein
MEARYASRRAIFQNAEEPQQAGQDDVANNESAGKETCINGASERKCGRAKKHCFLLTEAPCLPLLH